MSDLPDLLDRAAGAAGIPVDPTADLTRARRALARTRTRRGVAGLAGIAAVGVLGLALTRGGTGDDSGPVATDTSQTQELSPLAGPPTIPVAPLSYAIAPAPAGWQVQSHDRHGVVWARAGETTSPDDFEGKIVLMLTTNRPAGESLSGGSLWFADDTGGGYSRVTRQTSDGEPRGNLELQYPAGALTLPEALAMISASRALDGAQPAEG